MRKFTIKSIVVLLMCVCLVSTDQNVWATTYPNPASPTVSSSPSECEKIALLSGNIYEFASAYEKGKAERYYDGTDQFAPTPVTLSWVAESGAQYYTVILSQKADLSNAQSFVTFDTTLTIEDLFMGTRYYYQVVAHYAEKTVKSRVFEFETEYVTRTVDIEGISNTRDIGGYYTVDGKYRIRQGLVYRGGEAEYATEAGRQKFLYTYGIKTDLDLRGVKTTPFGDAVNHISVSAPYYLGSNGILTASYRDALIEEIKAFANPENYPIYVHCSLGRDRTGTLCFLISALCGVGEMELFLDYEISWFSVKGCYGNVSPEKNVNSVFAPLYQYINSYPVTGENVTLADRTEAFLKEYLGISQEEIDSIRSILLEEVSVG